MIMHKTWSWTWMSCLKLCFFSHCSYSSVKSAMSSMSGHISQWHAEYILDNFFIMKIRIIFFDDLLSELFIMFQPPVAIQIRKLFYGIYINLFLRIEMQLKFVFYSFVRGCILLFYFELKCYMNNESRLFWASWWFWWLIEI